MNGQCFKNYLWMALNRKNLSHLNKEFIKSYDEDSNKSYILDVEYPKDLKSTTDAVKTAWKRAIQKAVGATGDLIGNKIASKITCVSKRVSWRIALTKWGWNRKTKKRYIYISRKRQKIIDELRLAW